MLFNSYTFIFLFLPLVALGYFTLGKIDRRFAAGWLALSSLIFYGYWNSAYIGLLLGSVIVNYSFGWWIAKENVRQHHLKKRHLVILAIIFNLSLLAYFKYTNFFIQNALLLSGLHFGLMKIILPLGISFFTFTQIAFLVDTGQGKVKEYNFVHYLLFVTYFPHLIGVIVESGVQAVWG